MSYLRILHIRSAPRPVCERLVGCNRKVVGRHSQALAGGGGGPKRAPDTGRPPDGERKREMRREDGGCSIRKPAFKKGAGQRKQRSGKQLRQAAAWGDHLSESLVPPRQRHGCLPSMGRAPTTAAAPKFAFESDAANQGRYAADIPQTAAPPFLEGASLLRTVQASRFRAPWIRTWSAYL